jgi:hypothetical protein
MPIELVVVPVGLALAAVLGRLVMEGLLVLAARQG